MKFEKFKLWQLVKTFDEYGNSKEDYELIQEISLTLNEENIKTDGTDNKYFVKSYRGVTAFRSFEFGEEYKLTNSKHSFKVTSFINGRWTQLVLEEVVQ